MYMYYHYWTEIWSGLYSTKWWSNSHWSLDAFDLFQLKSLSLMAVITVEPAVKYYFVKASNAVKRSIQSRIDTFALSVCQTAVNCNNSYWWLPNTSKFQFTLDRLFQSFSIGYLTCTSHTLNYFLFQLRVWRPFHMSLHTLGNYCFIFGQVSLGKNYFANIYSFYLKISTIKDFVMVRVSMVLDFLFFAFLAGKWRHKIELKF